jgi:biotin carboxylase
MRLAVLGGSYLQSDFIEVLVDRNYEVHVFDANPNCYIIKNKKIIFHHIDFSLINNLEVKLKKIGVNYIFAPAGEKANEIAAEMCDRLKLNYNSIITVNVCRSKKLQRLKLKQHKTFKPVKSFYASNKNNYNLSGFTFPVIVKPDNSSASRGVSLVSSQIELPGAISNAFEFTSDGVLIEEVIIGQQISVETISANGNHKVVAYTEEFLSDDGNFIELKHVIDAKNQEYLNNLLEAGIYELLTLFGIQTGPCHIELFLNENQVSVIEIACRSGGWRDRLIKYAFNQSYNDQIIDAYLTGCLPDFEAPKTGRAEVKLLYTETDLKYLDFDDQHRVEVYLTGKKSCKEPKSLMDAVCYAYYKYD